MPVCALHLVRLNDASSSGIDSFLYRLFGGEPEDVNFGIVTVSRVQSPIIRPTRIDTTLLNATPRTLLLVASGSSAHVLPTHLEHDVRAHYSVVAGIPSKIVTNYHTISAKLRDVQPPPPLLEVQLDHNNDVVPPPSFSRDTRSDGQDLSLSPALLDLARHLNHNVKHHGAVSMLNLLHFHTAPGAVESYHEYGRRFATVAGKRGGNAKLVGVVISPLSQGLADSRGQPQRSKDDWWNECTLVHYPSINHFIDMSIDPEYQHINQHYRLSAIKDTALICTTEIDLAPFRSPGYKL